MISTEHRGSLYAILSGFLYGFVAYFGISVIRTSISIGTMLFWRFLIASIVVGVIVLWQIRGSNYSIKDLTKMFMSGVVFYGLSTMLYFIACPYIGSGLAMVIFFTYPALVMLLNHFIYGQTIPPIYYCAIVIILTGMPFFVDTHEMRFDLYGIGFSILSAFLYACYVVASKNNRLPPMITTFIVCLGCATTGLIFAWMDHSFTIPSSLTVWLDLLGIGVISTAIPVLLLLYSLEYIRMEKASILSVLEPLFVLIFGVTLLGEPMKMQYLVGVIIVLSGALLTLFSQKTMQ